MNDMLALLVGGVESFVGRLEIVVMMKLVCLALDGGDVRD